MIIYVFIAFGVLNTRIPAQNRYQGYAGILLVLCGYYKNILSFYFVTRENTIQYPQFFILYFYFSLF